MYNRTEHIYLYAKHWYKMTNDPIADVQTIIKNCEGQEFSRKDVIKITFHIALRHLTDEKSDGSTDFKFESFISNVDPAGSWKVGYYHNNPDGDRKLFISDVDPDGSWKVNEYDDRKYDYWESVFYASLSVLSLTDKKDVKRLSNIDFGDGHPLPEVFELLDK